MKIYTLPFIVLLFAGNIESSDGLITLSCKFKEIETEHPEIFDKPAYKNSKSLIINTTKKVVEYLGSYPEPYDEIGNTVVWVDKIPPEDPTDYWNYNLDRISGEFVVTHMTFPKGRSFGTTWYTQRFECKKANKLF